MLVETKFRNIRMSAQKLRTITKCLGGLRLEWVLKFLALNCSRRLRLIRKAVVQVANNIRSKGVTLASVKLANIRIDEASSHQTLQPRAKGRTDFLRHPSSHITIVAYYPI